MQPAARIRATAAATLAVPIKLYESIRGESPRRERKRERGTSVKGNNLRCSTKSTKRRFTRIRLRINRYVRICSFACAIARAVSARAQEAATVILQIISREHAILLKITRLRRGAGNAVLYTPAPFLAHVCAYASSWHARPPVHTTPTNVAKDARGSHQLMRVAFRRLLLNETLRHVPAVT